MTFHPPTAALTAALATAGLTPLRARFFPDLDDATLGAILNAAAAFTAHELAPLSRPGDRAGATIAHNRVTAPAGFAAAYREFAAAGWNGLAADPAYGGQGLPKALELAVFEMIHAANMAFGLCPTLTLAAIEALSSHGTPAQQDLVLPHLISGRWTGAMVLTESQAGSDLAALTTRAEPDGQGGYTLHGQKIYITWGDHDLAENICHFVLARTPGAPPGTRGISLFLAHKYRLNADGSLGSLNAVHAASLEHKLGLHASPTCVMIYEGAQAELVGELNQGLPHMFTMMNAARLQVGVQGVGIAERALQQACHFAAERRQGRAANASYPAAIEYHPDIRRMLLLMRSKTEACRLLCLTAGIQFDLARLAPDPAQREAAQIRLELLTPIAKAWCTDSAVEATSLNIQIHGGMGYIEEAGAAQLYREARIAPIYEGTNGIQAIDLITRKLNLAGATAMQFLIDEMAEAASALTAQPQLTKIAQRLTIAIAALAQITTTLAALPNPARLPVATAYLALAGDIVGGWLLASHACSTPAALPLAQFYSAEILVGAAGRAASIQATLDDAA